MEIIAVRAAFFRQGIVSTAFRAQHDVARKPVL
jgi:hypothetical protein